MSVNPIDDSDSATATGVSVARCMCISLCGQCPGSRRTSVVINWRTWSERGDSFNQPEAGEAANGVGREPPEPDGLRQSKPLRGAPANCDDGQNGRDEH